MAVIRWKFKLLKAVMTRKIETETAGATVWSNVTVKRLVFWTIMRHQKLKYGGNRLVQASASVTVSSSQCSPQPVTYVVLISSEPILGRLALVPAWDHCTIPSSAYENKAQWFPQGKCDTNSSAMAGNKFIFYEYEGTSVAIRQTNLNMIFMLIKRCWSAIVTTEHLAWTKLL